MRARLTEARLSSADLTGARLWDADLSQATFYKTTLSGVDLRRTKGVKSDQVRCAVVDDRTMWPNGVAGPLPGELDPEKCPV